MWLIHHVVHCRVTQEALEEGPLHEDNEWCIEVVEPEGAQGAKEEAALPEGLAFSMPVRECGAKPRDSALTRMTPT